MAIIETATPIQLSLVSFSANKNRPTSTEINIITVLFTAKIIELSRNFEFSAKIRKYKDPKFESPRIIPKIKVPSFISFIFFTLKLN